MGNKKKSHKHLKKYLIQVLVGVVTGTAITVIDKIIAKLFG